MSSVLFDKVNALPRYYVVGCCDKCDHQEYAVPYGLCSRCGDGTLIPPHRKRPNGDGLHNIEARARLDEIIARALDLPINIVDGSLFNKLEKAVFDKKDATEVWPEDFDKQDMLMELNAKSEATEVFREQYLGKFPHE